MLMILKILYATVCLFLVLVILMQRGKDAGGDLFGAGSSAVLSSQGTTSFLVKLTSTLAGLFFILSLALGFVINQSLNHIHLQDLANATVVEKVVDQEAKK
ncbi:MAG: preprotein translocase subunit SecG [Pseudomonadota bacterium]|nr:preprotein translocase subunit SecG [Pseudomonadota bacterium]